jgi:ribonuclease G
MTERVKRMLGMAPRQTGNKIVINCEKLERRVALLENGVLEEYSIERPVIATSSAASSKAA